MSLIKKERIRFVGYVLILLQSILLVIIALWILGNNYQKSADSYLSNKQNYSIYLNNVSNNRKDKFESYLLKSSLKNKLLFTRKDYSETSNNDPYLKIGIVGNVANKNVDFYFVNNIIISKLNIDNLLTNSNKDATIGMYHGSLNQIHSVYQPPFSNKLIIYKMNTLIKKSNTINGRYEIMGIKNHKQFQHILSDISLITNKSINDLSKPKSGVEYNNKLIIIIVIILLIISDIILTFTFIILFVRLIQHIGTLVLIGWSKIEIFLKISLPFFICSLVTTISSIIFLSFIFNEINVSFDLFRYFVFIEFINIFLTIFSLLFASMVLFFLKNISLIKNQFPKKILYFLIVITYLLISLGVVFIGYQTDKPMKSIVANSKVVRQWSSVKNMKILEHAQSLGNLQVDDLGHDMYHLYKNISNKQGVYIINSSYISRTWINKMKQNNVYRYLPEKPFWQITYSPNYAKKLGIKINEKDIQDANSGSRLYLIPYNISKSERVKLIRFIKEDVNNDISENDIKNSFKVNRKFHFINYHNNKKIFTWNSNPNSDDDFSKNPIIFISTPSNMSSTEIDGLYANGFNGYLKIESKKILDKYINRQVLKKYNLQKNNLKFGSINNYIDGLQKDLTQTIELFGIIFIIMILILTMLILILVNFFNIVNEEKIRVKKYLGFTSIDIYKFPLLVIFISIIVQINISIMFSIHINLLLIPISFLIQIFIFLKNKR